MAWMSWSGDLRQSHSQPTLGVVVVVRERWDYERPNFVGGRSHDSITCLWLVSLACELQMVPIASVSVSRVKSQKEAMVDVLPMHAIKAKPKLQAYKDQFKTFMDSILQKSGKLRGLKRVLAEDYDASDKSVAKSLP